MTALKVAGTVLRTGRQCPAQLELEDSPVSFYCDLPTGHDGDHSETFRDGAAIMSWPR